MAIGGVNRVNAGGANNGQGNSTAQGGGDSAGKEFSLEKQQTSAQQAALAGQAAGISRNKKSKSSQIVDRKKRNRKGAPRTVLVDGELYEVFLLAIA